MWRLCVRSYSVDHAAVVATLQVLLDAQWAEMDAENARDGAGVKGTVKKPRETKVGRSAYWKKSDFEGKNGAAFEFGSNLGEAVGSGFLGVLV